LAGALRGVIGGTSNARDGEPPRLDPPTEKARHVVRLARNARDLNALGRAATEEGARRAFFSESVSPGRTTRRGSGSSRRTASRWCWTCRSCSSTAETFKRTSTNCTDRSR